MSVSLDFIVLSGVSIHSDLKVETITEIEKPKKPVPYVRVDDYEELKRKGGLL